jgi:anti-sigma-K factor RskA
MNESLEELQQLAGEYVLGTLPPVQRAQIARRIADEPSLRAEIEAWERRLLPLTALAEPVLPSPQLWPRIAASLRPQPAAARPVAGTPGDAWLRWWDDLRLWRGLAGSALAASVVLGTLLVLRPATTAPGAPAYMVVLVAPQDRSAGWIVQASLDRHITLTPLHGTAVPEHKALQFWTKGPGWNGPVSLGLVAPERSLKMAINSLPPLQADQLFEITLEPENGSPTGKPSGPVLYIGRAVKVI